MSRNLTTFVGMVWAGALITVAAVAGASVVPEHDPLSPWVRQIHQTWCDQQMRGAPPAAWPARSPLFLVDDELFAQGWLRLQLDTGPGAEAASALRGACEAAIPDLRWEGDFGHLAQVSLPFGDLATLGEIPGVYSAMRPPTGLPLAMLSEGVAEMGAPQLHAQGIDGHGIKVGIIDVGFIGAHELLGSELPANTRMRAFVGSAAGEGDILNQTSHGTACAEIVHDVAPGAQLFLANAESTIELEAAIRWMKDEGVSIISHSVGWFWGPGDGTGEVISLVQQALDQEILWINAVGNQAQEFYGGPFRDTNGDRFHEFDALGDSTLTDLHVPLHTAYTCVLTWDRWPYSHDLSFELDLYENGVLVAASDQQATSPAGYAYRELFWTTSVAASQIDLVIRRKEGSDDASLRLFRFAEKPDKQHLPIAEHGTPAGSYLIPADAAEVISVGAYYASGGQPILEDFSSRGPTQGGLAKPEICALDRVTTRTSASFVGTSAACPHVAGAAALLYDAAPEGGFFDFRWSHEVLAEIMEGSAIESGFDDPAACQWGLLHLPVTASAQRKNSFVRGQLTATSPTTGEISLRLTGVSAVTPGVLEIFDAAGRLVHRIRLSADQVGGRRFGYSAGTAGTRILSGGLYLLRARGNGWEARGRTYLIR